ncbi:MAG: GGDEF domain-containing protein [Propionivibrio sp.]|nr:GGDEF domain-containing protein [Propionivibrio sp.]
MIFPGSLPMAFTPFVQNRRRPAATGNGSHPPLLRGLHASQAVLRCHKDGQAFWNELHVRRYSARRSDGDSLRQCHSGLSRRIRRESQLAHLAIHDPLTGLANRTLFNDRLLQAVARAPATSGWWPCC